MSFRIKNGTECIYYRPISYFKYGDEYYELVPRYNEAIKIRENHMTNDFNIATKEYLSVIINAPDNYSDLLQYIFTLKENSSAGLSEDKISTEISKEGEFFKLLIKIDNSVKESIEIKFTLTTFESLKTTWTDLPVVERIEDNFA